MFKRSEPPPAVRQLAVGLTARVSEELGRLQARTGMSTGDLINRAISLYHFIDTHLDLGDQVLMVSGVTGETESITLR